MKLQRYTGNPILTPHPDHDWENLVVTNPAAWYDKNKQEFNLLYRAAGSDPEHRIYLGRAVSRDGFKFERVSDSPIFTPSPDGFDAGCVEDPRVVLMGDTYFITYACRPFPPGQYWLPAEEKTYHLPNCPDDYPYALRNNATSTGLALTQDFSKFIRVGRLTNPMVDDRDVILFPEKIGGRYSMIHRPMDWVGEEYGTQNPTMWITFGDDLLHWGESQILVQAKYDWEIKMGGNTPPLKTQYGWLTLYHAVGPDQLYRLGALLLDLENPAKVLHRTSEWLMQPEEDYEINGFYPGVIFPCGKVLLDGVLYVYYGGADRYIGVATCMLEDLLTYLRSCPA